MVLSMNWLSDFVDCSDIDIKKYCDRMTDTGSKVEGSIFTFFTTRAL